MRDATRVLWWSVGALAVTLLASGCGDEGEVTPPPPPPEDSPPTIDLTAPDGGTAVAPGATIQITWAASDSEGPVTVDLYYTHQLSTNEFEIATGQTGTSYSWTVPSENLFGVKVKAVATDTAGQTATDESAAVFAIVSASARGYVTSSVCQSCHPNKYDDLYSSGHPYKLNKVVGGQPPTYPHSTVPNPPQGFTWNDITYVIGGFGWKARFMDSNGYIITDGWNGVNAQYNLPRDDLGGGLPAEWTSYHASDTSPKPYTCGACHTTGWQDTTQNGGQHQDGLVGIAGTWEETGIQCEQCHGPGLNHVVSISATDITVDSSAALCGSCHFRDDNHRTLTKGGYIRHHEQYDEMLLAGHSALSCNDCHEPHIGTRYGNAALGGIKVTCESCHADKTTNNHVVSLDCETCHMPRASKSARAVNTFQGDVRTHIFAIQTQAWPKDSMFVTDPADGKEIAQPWVTLDFVCYQCHVDPVSGEGGSNSQKTLDELSTRATGIHQ